MNPEDLAQEIREAARYIRDRRRYAHLWEKRAEDHTIIKKKLERVQRWVEAALKELGDLEWDSRFDERWFSYREAQQYVRCARERIGKALGPLSDAQVVIRRDPTTRAMWEQKTAINLAHALLEPPGKPNRKTRAVARRIMVAANIAEPSPEAMTKWLKEIRAEADARDRDARDRRFTEMPEKRTRTRK